MSRHLRTVTTAAGRRQATHRAYVDAILAARTAGATLTEIAAAAGISYQAVSRLLQRNTPEGGDNA